MNRGKSSQNRYCCVPLCDQKGSTGPNGERVRFFSIPTEKHLREQWLHAIRRESGKHFSVTDSTKVCSLHFKDEHLKKSFGSGSSIILSLPLAMYSSTLIQDITQHNTTFNVWTVIRQNITATFRTAARLKPRKYKILV